MGLDDDALCRAQAPALSRLQQVIGRVATLRQPHTPGDHRDVARPWADADGPSSAQAEPGILAGHEVAWTRLRIHHQAPAHEAQSCY
jgi:hypothetical protein